MLDFVNDYSEGAHEKILQRLLETNMEKLSGYGTDQYCESAKQKIREVCECPEADIYFLVGGTQTNATVIDAILSQYEGVVAANTGHISTHEAGAIEASAHKVLAIPHKNGKITAKAVKQYFADFYADGNHEHMVFPGMVYISHPTEYGTLYSKKELEELSIVCHEYDAPLYLDGARLGYGLVSEENDVTLADIASLCDAFYIGGTKVGALCGEAVVFPKNNAPNNIEMSLAKTDERIAKMYLALGDREDLNKKVLDAPKHFMTTVKQHGALLAKGRVLGVQFDTLFTDNLYFEISKNAIKTADTLKQALKEKGYTFYIDSPTNQIFLVLEDERLKELEQKVAVSFWEKADDNHTIIRLATSWATKEEEIKALIEIL